MKRYFTSVSIAVGLSLLYTGVVFAQGGTPTPEGGGEIAGKLAGLLAAATLVERIVEMIWDFVENNILTAKNLVSDVGDYVTWAKNQVHSARKALLNSTDADRSNLESKLRDAEKRMSDYLKSDTYVSKKKKISVPIALVLGLVVAFSAQLRMFVMLELLPSSTQGLLYFTDIFVTGLIIGTGSAPVHSLIGIIQKTKDTLDAARGMYSGKALNEVSAMIEILKQGEFEAAGDEKAKEKSAIELERSARSLVDL